MSIFIEFLKIAVVITKSFKIRTIYENKRVGCPTLLGNQNLYNVSVFHMKVNKIGGISEVNPEWHGYERDDKDQETDKRNYPSACLKPGSH